MTFATVQDVADTIGRPITEPLEVKQVERWLSRVESRIRRRIPNLNALAQDADYLETLKGVEVDVVARRVLNPEGKKNERIDDYSYGLTDTAASSDLWPTAAEWDELAPAPLSDAFSTRMAYTPDCGWPR